MFPEYSLAFAMRCRRPSSAFGAMKLLASGRTRHQSIKFKETRFELRGLTAEPVFGRAAPALSWRSI